MTSDNGYDEGYQCNTIDYTKIKLVKKIMQLIMPPDLYMKSILCASLLKDSWNGWNWTEFGEKNYETWNVDCLHMFIHWNIKCKLESERMDCRPATGLCSIIWK